MLSKKEQILPLIYVPIRGNCFERYFRLYFSPSFENLNPGDGYHNGIQKWTMGTARTANSGRFCHVLRRHQNQVILLRYPVSPKGFAIDSSCIKFSSRCRQHGSFSRHTCERGLRSCSWVHLGLIHWGNRPNGPLGDFPDLHG